MGGNIRIEVPQGKEKEKVRDSKSLNRWVSKLIKEIIKETIQRYQIREVTIMRLS